MYHVMQGKDKKLFFVLPTSPNSKNEGGSMCVTLNRPKTEIKEKPDMMYISQFIVLTF